MVEGVLVKESLNDREVTLGEQLIDRLDSAGLPVTAAYWLYTQETNSWRLDIVSREVDHNGEREAYRAIRKIIFQEQQFESFARINYHVLGLRDRFFKQMLEAIRTDRALAGVDLSHLVVGNELVDLFIYRFPQTLLPGTKKGSKHA